jgi:hypothetical protein
MVAFELPRNVKLGPLRRTVDLFPPKEWRALTRTGGRPSRVW